MVGVQINTFFAQGTFQLLLEPEVDATGVELVRAGQCFHHLASLEVVQADCARVGIRGFFFRVRRLFFLFVLETRDGIDDVLDFFRRLKWLSVFVDIFFGLTFELLFVLLVKLFRHLLPVVVKLLVRMLGKA